MRFVISILGLTGVGIVAGESLKQFGILPGNVSNSFIVIPILAFFIVGYFFVKNVKGKAEIIA